MNEVPGENDSVWLFVKEGSRTKTLEENKRKGRDLGSGETKLSNVSDM